MFDMVAEINQQVIDALSDVERIVHTVNEESQKQPLGTYHVTAYAWTGNPCANGEYPVVGRTVACNSLPLGTRVYIEDLGEYIVEDRGASWHSDNWIDLYLGETQTCLDWGNQERMVYIVGE